MNYESKHTLFADGGRSIHVKELETQEKQKLRGVGGIQKTKTNGKG